VKTLNSYYDVLGVRPNAEEETLRRAYRKLAQRHHPDVNKDPKAHETMARINQAFKTLIDPSLRSEYDALLAGNEPVEREAMPRRPLVVKLAQRLSGHKTPVYAMTFSPDDDQLITCGFDNELLWWDGAEFPVRKSKIDHGLVSVMHALPNDRVVTVGSAENMVSIGRMDEARMDHARVATEEWVGALAISPDGRSVAAGSIHNAVTLFDVETGDSRYRKLDHEGSVMAVAFSPDGSRVASGGADARVNVYDAESGRLQISLTQLRSAVTALAFSPNQRFLAAAGVDLSIRVFDLTQGGALVKMMFGHTKVVESLAFHPNGWLFTSAARDGSVGLWNAARGIGNVRIEASPRPMLTSAFSRDGKRLAAAGQDRIVRIWNVEAKEA
jgi:WD40 repeat protein